VRISGVKLAVDGYALMHNPPEDRRHGHPDAPTGQFEAIIAEIHKAGLTADVHAVGDKGVDWTLDAFQKRPDRPARCARCGTESSISRS